jgi:hypothetical protein
MKLERIIIGWLMLGMLVLGYVIYNQDKTIHTQVKLIKLLWKDNQSCHTGGR